MSTGAPMSISPWSFCRGVEGLTYTFLDPSAWMFFDTMVHNSKDNSYLAVYDIERTATSANECWGLIYK